MKEYYFYIIAEVFLLLIVTGAFAQSSKNPSEVFIQQAEVEYNDGVLQFTGDFTTAFFRQMALDSIDEYDSVTNVAILNQFAIKTSQS